MLPHFTVETNEVPLLAQRNLDILHHFWKFKDGALQTELMSLSVTIVLFFIYRIWLGGLSRHAQWLFPMYVKWEAWGMPGFSSELCSGDVTRHQESGF